jgi:hypothetical protein
MPLPRLPNMSFAHHCPHCGAARVNTGVWFYAIGGYKCEGCGNAIRVTYEDKIKLLNGSGVRLGEGSLMQGGDDRHPGHEMDSRSHTADGASWSRRGERRSRSRP